MPEANGMIKDLRDFRLKAAECKENRDVKSIRQLTGSLARKFLGQKSGINGHQGNGYEMALARFKETIAEPYVFNPEPGLTGLGEEEQLKRLVEALARIEEHDRKILLEGDTERTTVRKKPITEITKKFPPPILRMPGKGGCLLAEGSVCLLAGEGGIAKSTLALDLAASISHTKQDAYDWYILCNGLLEIRIPGDVLYLTFEDDEGVLKERYNMIRKARWPDSDPAYQLFVMDMTGFPLFGPPADGLYNARPRCLPGWDMMVQNLEGEKRIRLVIIDPALSAFVGNANEAAAVREFTSALTLLAKQYRCGILLIAHSNKESRKTNGNYDPFSPAQIGGSTHWTDSVRGVLTMQWGNQQGERVLAIAKSNWGPSRLVCRLDKVEVEGERHFSGFDRSDEGWIGASDYTTGNCEQKRKGKQIR